MGKDYSLDLDLLKEDVYETTCEIYELKSRIKHYEDHLKGLFERIIEAENPPYERR